MYTSAVCTKQSPPQGPGNCISAEKRVTKTFLQAESPTRTRSRPPPIVIMDRPPPIRNTCRHAARSLSSLVCRSHNAGILFIVTLQSMADIVLVCQTELSIADIASTLSVNYNMLLSCSLCMLRDTSAQYHRPEPDRFYNLLFFHWLRLSFYDIDTQKIKLNDSPRRYSNDLTHVDLSLISKIFAKSRQNTHHQYRVVTRPCRHSFVSRTHHNITSPHHSCSQRFGLISQITRPT